MDECYVCQKLTKTRCSKCHQTYYCSEECQKIDWKEHKKSCKKPLVVKTDDSLFTMDGCYVCQKPTNTRCSKCHQTYYCSKECQKIDWKEHKKSCGNPLVVETDETIDEYEEYFMQKFINNMKLYMDTYTAVDWELPDFGKEYAIKYPHEKEHIELLSSARLSLRL